MIRNNNHPGSFYTYYQNNSGGVFRINEQIAHYVIIEADYIEDAESKAKSIGIYYNGVFKGIDCSCCGDRWRDPEVYKEPTIYDWVGTKSIQEYISGDEVVYIYYLDDTREVITENLDSI